MSSDQKKIATHFSVAPKPTINPKPSELPNVTKGTTTISSPDLGSCKGNISWTLNSTQIGFSFTAEDVLPASDCATFADKVAESGVEATIANVPYPNGGSATVKITLKP